MIECYSANAIFGLSCFKINKWIWFSAIVFLKFFNNFVKSKKWTLLKNYRNFLFKSGRQGVILYFSLKDSMSERRSKRDFKMFFDRVEHGLKYNILDTKCYEVLDKVFIVKKHSSRKNIFLSDFVPD